MTTADWHDIESNVASEVYAKRFKSTELRFNRDRKATHTAELGALQSFTETRIRLIKNGETRTNLQRERKFMERLI